MQDEENSDSPSTHSIVHVVDPAGGAFVADVCTWIDADKHPSLLEQLRQGTLHRVRRPNGEWLELAVTVAVRLGSRLSREFGKRRQPDDHLLFLPTQLAHTALEERARLLERMQQGLPSGRIETVVGTDALNVWLDVRVRRRSSPQHQIPTDATFAGSMGSTMLRPFNARDRSGRSFMTTVHTSVNLDDDPHLVDELLQGNLNVVVSPFGGDSAQLPVPVILHKPSERLFILFLPTSLAHRVNEEEARLLRRLSDNPLEIPPYVLNFESVVGVDAIRQHLTERNSEVVRHTRKTPVSPLPRIGESEPHMPAVARLPRQMAPYVPDLDESLIDEDFEFADEDTIRLGLRARERVGGPNIDPNRTNPALRLITTVSDRYLGEDPSLGWFSIDKTPVPLVAWQIDASQMDLWKNSRMRLLVQMHNLQEYPLICLILVAVAEDDHVVDELMVCFDARNPDHRRYLEALNKRFVVTAALYGPSSSLADAAQFIGRLEVNVGRMLDAVDRRLQRDEGLDYKAAVAKARAHSFPRIGPMRHPFAPRMFSELDTPSETQLALSILSYWCQEPNRRYLFFNQSFSAARFEQIEARVLTQAVELGLRLPALLRRHAAAQLGLGEDVVISRLLANFAEVYLNLSSNDLDPYALWENWRLLLEDAEEFVVEVDAELLDLARQSLRAAERFEAIASAMAEDGEMLSEEI